MNSPSPTPKGRQRPALPRWAVPPVWAVLVAIIMGLLPWAASLIGPRYGWSQGTPGLWNWVGILPIVAGLGGYVWCLVFHYRSYRASVRLGFEPPHLVVSGPYKISRNPMYVSGLFVWLGWTGFYGSPAVLVGMVLLWLLFTFRVIPYEEHQLEELFGDEYREYKRSVRRWIGRSKAG